MLSTRNLHKLSTVISTLNHSGAVVACAGSRTVDYLADNFLHGCFLSDSFLADSLASLIRSGSG